MKARLARGGSTVLAATLALAVIAAVVVAHHERPPLRLPSTAPAGASSSAAGGRSLHLDAGVSYGEGLSHVVGAPAAQLEGPLGDSWRELGRPVGRAYLVPSGNPAHYFEISMVVAARHPGRLQVLTSEGQSVVEPIGLSPVQTINLGPLRAPQGRGIGIAVRSLRRRGNGVGPNVVLSPFEAEYLSSGEWVSFMPALATRGPSNTRGVALSAGSSTRFAMTPGIRGACYLELLAASTGGAQILHVTVAGETQSTSLNAHLGPKRIGPFRHATSVLAIRIDAAAPGRAAGVFLTDVHFVPAR